MDFRSAPQLPPSPLSPLLSSTCALSCAREPSQALCRQSLPHSFPCRRGGRGSSAQSPATRHHLSRSSLQIFPLYFQRLPRCSTRNPFLFMFLHCCPGVAPPPSNRHTKNLLAWSSGFCSVPRRARHVGGRISSCSGGFIPPSCGQPSPLISQVWLVGKGGPGRAARRVSLPLGVLTSLPTLVVASKKLFQKEVRQPARVVA